MSNSEEQARGRQKRSVRINGKSTTISLEPEFWTVLDRAAASEGGSVAAMAARIDQNAPINLAAALRLHALRYALRHGGGNVA